VAIAQKREWSSIPVTTLHSVPSSIRELSRRLAAIRELSRRLEAISEWTAGSKSTGSRRMATRPERRHIEERMWYGWHRLLTGTRSQEVV
jgi:hypothetical protein